MNSQKQSGMTLVEITVVLLALVALSAIVVPYVAGTGSTASCQATDATLIAVKEAIMGGKSGPGYYDDLLGVLPSETGTAKFNLHYLAERGGQRPFSAQTAVGWRGPYLANLVTLSAERLSQLHASFADSVIDPIAGSDQVKTVHVNHLDVSKNYRYVLDAWGQPIILQVPTDDGDQSNSPNCTQQQCARLVSAGPNGIIDTALTNNQASDNGYEQAQGRFDDRVLFLMMADPYRNGNQTCD